jgi:hypothetical protein
MKSLMLTTVLVFAEWTRIGKRGKKKGRGGEGKKGSQT